MRYVEALDDDRVHREQEDQRFVGWQTVCGRQIAATQKLDGPWCHACFPDKAHSMEPIWEACRRWDCEVDALADRSNRARRG